MACPRKGYNHIEDETNCYKPTCEKITTWTVLGVFSAVITLFVISCLIAAFARDLGGKVKIKEGNPNPCALEVDASSGRRIYHLIHNEEIKFLSLVLKFPEGAEVKKTKNIFRAYHMVWTIGGQPGTKHFLDLPWMYLSWSFGLLDHYTYRNVDLKLRILGNDTCSLFLGTNETTRAIGNALLELTLNNTREDKQIDKEVMNSVWCQAYFKDDISPSFKNFAKLFRFYYSDFRYMCSHLDFNFSSNKYEVVTEDKHRPLTRQWSWLPFLFSIVSLWFSPLFFLYLESLSYDEENIYLGVNSPSTFVNILRFLFQDCCSCGKRCKSSSSKCKMFRFSESKSCDQKNIHIRVDSPSTHVNIPRSPFQDCCSCSHTMLFLFLIFACPSGTLITYLILYVDSEARTMLSELNERDNAHAWFSVKTPTQFFTSDGLPLMLYFFFTMLLYIILCCKNCKWKMREKPNTQGPAEFEGWRILFYWIPWLYVSWKFETIIRQFKIQSKKSYTHFVIVSIILYFFWIFFALQILFKSLMFFYMFFSFGILSVLTFPKFMSGIVTYILTGVWFFITRVYYLPNEYYKFLTLIVGVIKEMKLKCIVNRKGDLGISKALFSKLVYEHQPMRKMILKIIIELFFVVPLLVWTGLWIRDLNQWIEIDTIKNILIAGIIYNVPNILQILFFPQHDDIMKRRLVKSINKFCCEITFNGIIEAFLRIERALNELKEALKAEEEDNMTEMKNCIDKARTGIHRAYRVIEQTCNSMEQGFHEIEQCHDLPEIMEASRALERASREVDKSLSSIRERFLEKEQSHDHPGIEQTGSAITQAEGSQDQPFSSIEQPYHDRPGIEQASTELKQAQGGFVQVLITIEQDFLELEQRDISPQIGYTRREIKRVIELIKNQEFIIVNQDQIRTKIEQMRRETEQACRAIIQCYVCSKIREASQAIKKVTDGKKDVSGNQGPIGTQKEQSPVRTQEEQSPVQTQEEQSHVRTENVQCHVYMETDKTPKEVEQEVKGQLRHVCDGLQQAQNSLGQFLVWLKQVHNKHDCDGTEQVDDSKKKALDGLHKTAHGLKQAQNGIEQARYALKLSHGAIQTSQRTDEVDDENEQEGAHGHIQVDETEI